MISGVRYRSGATRYDSPPQASTVSDILGLTIFFLAATCCLLIIFASSLDPDHELQNIHPDLDQNRLTLW